MKRHGRILDDDDETAFLILLLFQTFSYIYVKLSIYPICDFILRLRGIVFLAANCMLYEFRLSHLPSFLTRNRLLNLENKVDAVNNSLIVVLNIKIQK